MSRLLGGIRQNGYVVHDIEAAMQYWTETLGVGPFFYFEKAPVHDFRYGDEASDIDVSIALANSGDLQIELIQQRNKAPSMYLDFLDLGYEGLQHIAYWSENYDHDLISCLEHGFKVGQSGWSGAPDGRFVYFQSQGHGGTVVELSEVSGAKGHTFAKIKQAALKWDGHKPIIRL